MARCDRILRLELGSTLRRDRENSSGNYEPKEVTAYVSFDRHEIEMYRCVQPSIGFELFQNLASGLGTIDFNPIELLVFDENIDSFIRKRSDPNEKKYDLSIVLEIDFVLSKME